jgi:geranylgeranyl diphosphate synthase, type II
VTTEPVRIETAAQLLVATVAALAARAPAIVAAAAHQLGGIRLGLHFGDDSHAELATHHSRLLATATRPAEPHVEAYFDDRSLNLLFDRERLPVDQLLAGSLDVRGEREDVLAVWRTFQLLSQRASGLRAVQALWRAYRDRSPDRWGAAPTPYPLLPAAGGQGDAPLPAARATGWRALDYLDVRYPEDTDVAASVVGETTFAGTRTLWDGRASRAWWLPDASTDADLMETLQACKARVREEMVRVIPDREPKAELYDLVRDYPTREGKGLRPTLTLATCAALGASSEDAVRAAAAIELFHNGFLVHDDVADESTHRRGLQTLHTAHGVGLAVNTGDAMNLLAIDTVLSNLPNLGLARTIGLIHEIMHMCRETVEGQAIELGWIRHNQVPERDEDYFHMSTKKTGWYTCISPCRLGAVCAGVTDPNLLDRFNEAFRLIGIAFQIQDDILNLVGEEALYGKEPLGDLLEGKRTVMMIHLFREADPHTRRQMAEIVRLSRGEKSDADAREMLTAMDRVGSIEYGIALADRLAHQGVDRFERDLAFVPETEGKGVLRQIANYVTTRPL